MELEIKVMWCKGLTSFNYFQKLNVYTLVSIKCEDQRIELTKPQKQEQRTPTDEQGDANPEWNHTLFFDLRPLLSISPAFINLSIFFEFRHQGLYLGDKTIGEVSVPLKTLIESTGSNVVRFVSYEVRSPEGKHNGVLDFSYKIVTKDQSPNNNLQITGYNHSHSHSHGEIVGHQHQQYELVEQSSSSSSLYDLEKIEYPRIDVGDWSYYPVQQSVAGVYPPPQQQQQQWGSPPPRPHHFQPVQPPPPGPGGYPPPQYGGPHWGYYRPPSSYNHNNPNGGYPHW